MRLFTYCLLLLPFFGWSQFSIEVNLTAGDQPVVLNRDILLQDRSFQLNQARFYLSKFEFYHQGQLIASDPVEAYLVDFEIDSTRKLIFPSVPFSQIDEIRFLFGIDSVTNTSGAMNGALDPMHGMYWSWQSGYINCKLEGFIKTPERQEFQLHLGGYAQPFSGARRIVLQHDGAAYRPLNIDLNALMGEVIRPESDVHVMSPSVKAVAYAQLLAQSIDLNP
jgi:hypothetical protein